MYSRQANWLCAPLIDCVTCPDQVGVHAILTNVCVQTGKEWGRAHFRQLYLHGMTQQQLRSCAAAYRQVAGHNIYKKRTEIAPWNWFEKVEMWTHANLWPLCARMHAAHKVRFMLLTDSYVMSWKWVSAGPFGVPEVAAAALARLSERARLNGSVEVLDVVRVMSKGTWKPNLETGIAASPWTSGWLAADSTFDDMELPVAKNTARALLNQVGADPGTNIYEIDYAALDVNEANVDAEGNVPLGVEAGGDPQGE